jgi:hypothetical protein
MMNLSTSIRKNCNTSWTAGNNGGALDTLLGSTLVANTWYHVFLISRVDTGATDILLSTNPTTPFFPLFYSKKRRIGSIRTDASAHIIQFIQVGDRFMYLVTPGAWDFTGQTIATFPSFTTFTINTPPAVRTTALITVANTAAASTWTIVKSPDVNMPVAFPNTDFGPSTTFNDLQIETDTSSRVQAASSAAVAGQFYLLATGWIDNRGK